MQEKHWYDISYKSSKGRLVHMHKQAWSRCNGRAKKKPEKPQLDEQCLKNTLYDKSKVISCRLQHGNSLLESLSQLIMK